MSLVLMLLSLLLKDPLERLQVPLRSSELWNVFPPLPIYAPSV